VFGIGAPELIFILILALLIFGPKRLPQIGRTLGKGMAEFRRASTELQRAINTQIEEPEPSFRPARSAAPATVTPAAAAVPNAEPITPGSGRAVESAAETAGTDSGAASPARE
jgi:TatA/E family protein of Tat protein translocase